jgi:hypothetical protein
MTAGFFAGEPLFNPTAWGTRDLMGMLFEDIAPANPPDSHPSE